jgi:hypothetical protein
MAEAGATEVQIAGYLRTLEDTHLSEPHSAQSRRAMGIALWHIAKVAEVRERARRLLSEAAASAPSEAPVPLSSWLAERLLRNDQDVVE